MKVCSLFSGIGGIDLAFQQALFNVTTSSTGKGTATPSLTVGVGETARIDFDAEVGYKIKDVMIDGVSIGAVDHYTFVDVRNNHTVSVEFDPDVWMIVGFFATLALLLALIVFLILRTNMKKKRQLQEILSLLSDTELDTQIDDQIDAQEEQG